MSVFGNHPSIGVCKRIWRAAAERILHGFARCVRKLAKKRSGVAVAHAERAVDKHLTGTETAS